MDNWPALVVVIVVAVAVWFVMANPPAVFVVRIRDGVPQTGGHILTSSRPFARPLAGDDGAG